MLINKNGKLFGKISIIDIFAIIIIVVAAFGIYTRFFAGNEKVKTSSSCIEYTLSVKDVRTGTVTALEKLGPISNATTKEAMGDIVSVSYKEAAVPTVMSDGTIKNTNPPDRYDVLVTVRVDGSVNNSGFYTGSNQPLSIGSSFVITSKYAKTSGRIMSIKEVK